MVELLLLKGATAYRSSFRHEGVLPEIELLAERPISTRKEKEKDQPDIPLPVDGIDLPMPMPPASTSSSKRPHLIELEDAYTLCSRVIRFKYLAGDVDADGDAN